MYVCTVYIGAMHSHRGVGDGWAGWAIAHPGFGRSVIALSQPEGADCAPTLVLAHLCLGSCLRD